MSLVPEKLLMMGMHVNHISSKLHAVTLDSHAFDMPLLV